MNTDRLLHFIWAYVAFALLFLVGCAAPQGPPPNSSPTPSLAVAPSDQGGASSMPSPLFPHDALDSFLARQVDQEGRIDYARVRSDRRDLDLYLDQIESVSPDSNPSLFPNENARLAYWINAYNASVIGLVLDHYPITSVQDLQAPWFFRFLPKGAGFFVFERITLGKKRTRLYTLENALIRKRFDDPRVHFALNCASASCPRLPAEAFQAERLEEQLERETRRFLSESRNVEIDPTAQEIHLSAILNWYEKDFPEGLYSFLAKNSPPDRASRLRECAECTLHFSPYDWSLNDRSSP